MSGHLPHILCWGSRYCCFIPDAGSQEDSRTHPLECVQCVSGFPPPPLLQVQVQQQKAGVQRRARVEHVGSTDERGQQLYCLIVPLILVQQDGLQVHMCM